MKKFLLILLVTVLFVSMMSTAAFAFGDRGKGGHGNGHGNRIQQQVHEQCTVTDYCALRDTRHCFGRGCKR